MSSQRPELSEYQAAADQGRLIRSLSSDGYAIFKYSKEVARDRDWDLVTLTARGHVWDLETETCVATPFDKFFNLNELDDDFVTDFGHPGSRWTEDEIRESIPFEKMDGSLGVVWLDRAGEVRVNTSGAFESEQALWASQSQDFPRLRQLTRDRFRRLCSGTRREIAESVYCDIVAKVLVTEFPEDAKELLERTR